MALVVFDRVQETTTTSGTGSVTLLGAVSGFQSFAVVGNTNTTYYTITDGAAWEVGIGTYSTSGPTLARTTVLSNSNGNTTPITLSGGLAQVFVTYTAEKSVNLDASDNVTPLGTIASGTWQGTTVGVSYGGTGVTASSGANSVVLRDANQNTSLNNIFRNITSTVSAAGTTVLTAASSFTQVLTGTLAQTYQLPDATTLTNGASFQFNNNSTGALSIVNNGSGPVATVAAGGATQLFLTSTSTANGTWDTHGFLPENILWGTNSLYLATDVITGGTWNGGTIGTAYGGTGLTTFTSGGALYATSTSSLTSGTLPVTAGGTNVTSFTANGIVYGSGTSALGVTSAGTTGQVLLANTGGAPTWGSVPSTGAVTSFQTSLNGLTPSTASTGAVTLAGTLGATSGGTGLSAYTTGDIIYASATNTLSALADVATGNALISGGVGVAPSWGKIGLTTHVDGVLPVANGGTGQSTYTDGQLLIGNSTGNTLTKASLTAGTGISVTPGSGSITIASTVTAGLTITDDTTTATSLYPTFTSATSGSITGASVTSTKFKFVPSTGTLTAPNLEASNGMIVNSATVSTNYSIPSGSNAIAVGPVTVAGGAAVTIPSGSRWLVL
jgi:trimeric autotransporter adhesin